MAAGVAIVLMLVWAFSLVVVAVVIAVAFFVDETKKTGCLITSVSLLLILLCPALLVWIS